MFAQGYERAAQGGGSGCLPVQDESVWDVDPLQVRGVVLWYAKEVQVVSLLLVADLCPGRKAQGQIIYAWAKGKISRVLPHSAPEECV